MATSREELVRDVSSAQSRRNEPGITPAQKRIRTQEVNRAEQRLLDWDNAQNAYVADVNRAAQAAEPPPAVQPAPIVQGPTPAPNPWVATDRSTIVERSSSSSRSSNVGWLLVGGLVVLLLILGATLLVPFNLHIGPTTAVDNPTPAPTATASPAPTSNSGSSDSTYKVGDKYSANGRTGVVSSVDSNGHVMSVDWDSTSSDTGNTGSGNGQVIRADTGSGQPADVISAQPSASDECTQQPYCLYGNQQIGHPSMYIETGVPCSGTPSDVKCDVVGSDAKHTKKYTFHVQSDAVGIIAGFRVDGVENGVYKAVQGPANVTTTVTDGFVLVIQSSWANNEFCFRIHQTEEFDQAHQHQSPLSGWTSCSAPAK